MLHQVKELSNDSGRPKVIIILPIKTKWLLLRSSALSVFCIELSLHLPSFKVWSLHMTINFALRFFIGSRHSNINFVHHFVIYWLLQNGAKKNQHQESHQKETIHYKFVFFFFFFFSKSVRQKTQ